VAVPPYEGVGIDSSSACPGGSFTGRSRWARPAAGSAFRRGGEVGEVVEELRGLGEAGGEVLVEDDFGGVVERVLGQALAVVAALPGVPQGVGGPVVQPPPAGDRGRYLDQGLVTKHHIRPVSIFE